MPNTQTIAGRSLGIGLNGISAWSTEIPFVDAFKSARGWFTQNSTAWDTQEKLDLDANGWVRSLPTASSSQSYRHAGTLLQQTSTYRPGRYVVMYDGTGTLEYGLDAKKVDADSAVGRDVLQVDSAKSGIYLKIKSTDPNHSGDYIRNIRVYHESDLPLVELGVSFSPDFLQKIKEFGTLRFMDWMRTNNSTQRDWSNRPMMNDATWGTDGAPVELMVKLANETGTSPWFNMPHQATDDYIRQFATYVRDHLDPKLKAYVEFSNEVWNWQFGQTQYAQKQAEARWGKTVEGGYLQWYGMRSAQTADIWKSVFGSQTDRMVSVISTQTGWQGLEDSILNTPNWVAEGKQPAWKSMDAYAITGYFSGNLGNSGNVNTIHSWLSEPDGGFGKAFKQLREGGLLPSSGSTLLDTIKDFQYHAGVAKKYGLQLVGYEGGQHIVGIQGVENDTKLADFFMALNRRPEMRQLYQELLAGWHQAGGTLFNHFVDVASSDKWGSWGSLEHLNQTTSPKYGALMDFISQHDRWWNDSTSGVKAGQYRRGGAGNDNLGGTSDSDILLGGTGNDTINGSTGDDRLHGEAGNDYINADIGDDRIGGGTGNDNLIGGTGSDVLLGGAGDDLLNGGEGKDIYRFDTGKTFNTADVGIDKIWLQAEDKISLSPKTFEAGVTFGRASSDTEVSTKFATIVYNTSTGSLFYNQNGAAAGLGSGGQFATLVDKPWLSQSAVIATNNVYD